MSSWLITLPVGLAVAHGCGAGGNQPEGGRPTAGSSSGGDGSGNETGSGKGGGNTIGIGGLEGEAGASGGDGNVMVGGCGDGILQPSRGEACDDGNNSATDGCAADCSLVEQDFVCLTPGEPCTSTVECGDSSVSGAETCDDGNTDALDGCDLFCQVEIGYVCPVVGSRCQAALCGDGVLAGLEQCEDDDGATPTGADGCSADCQVEPGWVCDSAGQACRMAVCGDGVEEGGEPCDDPNNVVGDGCSPGCVPEPTCTYPIDTNGCSSQCGDGLILPGEVGCDDGNRQNGDGCSDACEVEDGYECMLEEGALPGQIALSFVFRDFVAHPSIGGAVQRHPDFQNGCLGTVLENVVASTLDVEGKPVNSGDCVLPLSCVPDVDYTDPTGDFCLDRDGPGCTNNELSACERATHRDHPLAGHPGEDPFDFWYRDTAGVSRRIVQTINLSRPPASDVFSFGSGDFYPLDGLGWVAQGEELERDWQGQLHNYGFTSEVRYWFQFQGGESLTFTGDDDLFVFVNGQLALSIGGKHLPATRTMVLNTNDTATCAACELANQTRPVDLTVGNVYEIAIFHAERQSVASNFNLSLTGFVSQKSECVPICGDGTQTFDEECDNGDDNDIDAYGGCTPSCTQGPHCGDAILQVGEEDCDDGTNLTTYSLTGMAGCAPGCVFSGFCGDQQLDSLFGEECDDGVNAGGYNGCDTDCTLGPRCGDGDRQSGEEQCDDGNLVSGDGCSSECDLEAPK